MLRFLSLLGSLGEGMLSVPLLSLTNAAEPCVIAEVSGITRVWYCTARVTASWSGGMLTKIN